MMDRIQLKLEIDNCKEKLQLILRNVVMTNYQRKTLGNMIQYMAKIEDEVTSNNLPEREKRHSYLTRLLHEMEDGFVSVQLSEEIINLEKSYRNFR